MALSTLRRRNGTALKPKTFHGWRVVAAGSVLQAIQGGLIVQAFGSYAVLLEQQFGWSRTTMSVAYSVNRANNGLIGPVQVSRV